MRRELSASPWLCVKIRTSHISSLYNAPSLSASTPYPFGLARLAIFLSALLFAPCPIAIAQEPDSKKEPKLEGRGAWLAALRDSAFKPELLKARQQRVMDELPVGAILIAAAASPPLRDYEGYEQNPDFLYLTGLDQGPALLVITGRREAMQSRLFVPRPNPMRELWEGPLKKARDLRAAGFNEVLELPEIEKLWSELVHEDSRLCLTGLGGPEMESLKLSIPEKAKVESASPALALARVRKDPAELALIREAINVTGQAQLQAMASVRPDQYEFELQAVVEYVFRRLGAQRPAFRSIIGSGRRACILHYNANDGLMKAGELVIVDIGARIHGYCADITRTIPVSGRFTGRQREIYELVLAAQAAALAAVKPGAKLADVHQAAAESFDKAGYREYFPHGTSHWLGIETHDAAATPRNLELAPGMVLTVEPGLYIPDEEIGVRIEDIVLVTETGYELLSSQIPKAPKELEELVRRGGGLGRHPLSSDEVSDNDKSVNKPNDKRRLFSVDSLESRKISR